MQGGVEQSLRDPSKKPLICRLQGALIGLVFTSLLAYVVVLTVSGRGSGLGTPGGTLRSPHTPRQVSLFRIFVRVSRR